MRSDGSDGADESGGEHEGKGSSGSGKRCEA